MSGAIIGANSRLDSDTVVVSPVENTNFPAINLSDDRTYTIFKPTSASSTVTITTDAGVGNTVDVDYFMALAHDFFDPASDGNGAVDIEFEHSADDISYSSIFTETGILDNKIILRKFTEATNRYFRLSITRVATFIPLIGQLQWGKAVVFPAGSIHKSFDPQMEIVKNVTSRSQLGHILGAVRFYQERRADIKAKLMTNAFVRDETVGGFQDFWDNHGVLLKPFVWSWNAGNPGNFEKDSFFCQIDEKKGVRRPIVTPLDVGFRDLQFSVIGVKE
jgi:hypothetical protein